MRKLGAYSGDAHAPSKSHTKRFCTSAGKCSMSAWAPRSSGSMPTVIEERYRDLAYLELRR